MKTRETLDPSPCENRAVVCHNPLRVMPSGSKGGRQSPRYKHGGYVGEKNKKRQPTPRTGAVDVVRAWIRKNLAVGSTFEAHLLLDALQSSGGRRRINSAIANLVRIGELETLSYDLKKVIRIPARKLSLEHKQKLSAAHAGKKHTELAKEAIGAGVRKGGSNKVGWSTRIDERALDKLKRLSKRDRVPMAQMVESWISSLT